MDGIRWEGRFLRIRETGRWEWTQRTNAVTSVNVVPLTDDDELIVIEQFRVPVNQRVVEWPAGLVGDVDATKAGEMMGDETPLDAARRELLEECGYTAEKWIDCGTFPSSAGLTDECNHMILALHARQVGAGDGVGDERITVHRVPRAGIVEFLKSRTDVGSLVTPHLLAGLWLLEQQCEGLI